MQCLHVSDAAVLLFYLFIYYFIIILLLFYFRVIFETGQNFEPSHQHLSFTVAHLDEGIFSVHHSEVHVLRFQVRKPSSHFVSKHALASDRSFYDSGCLCLNQIAARPVLLLHLKRPPKKNALRFVPRRGRPLSFHVFADNKPFSSGACSQVM